MRRGIDIGNKLENLQTVHIEMKATAGAHLNACIEESVLIAATQWKDVEFTHNDRRYCVKVSALKNCVREVRERPTETKA